MIKRTTRNIASNNIELSKVALKLPAKKEELPFLFVHYPTQYGTFISFSKTPDSEHYLCTDLGIRLVEVDFTEPLTFDSNSQNINSYL